MIGLYDCHAHIIGPTPHDADWPHETPAATLSDYISELDANGIAKGVLVQPRAHGFDNSLILDAIARYPNRLRGVAVVPADADADTLHKLHAAGIRGVRLGGKVAVSELPRVWPNLARAGLHVQLLMRRDDLLRHADAIANCPVPVIIDHLAHPDPLEGVDGLHVATLNRLLSLGHVFAKLTAVYRWAHATDHGDARAITTHIASRHASRLVWGSDWPFLNQPTPGPSFAGQMAFFHHAVPDRFRTAILEYVPRVLYGI